jgi:hypothetical protein
MSNYFSRAGNGLRSEFSRLRNIYNFRVEKLNKDKDSEITRSENRIEKAEQDYEQLVIEQEATKAIRIADAESRFCCLELRQAIASINRSINLVLLNDPKRGRREKSRVINREKKKMVRIERDFPQKVLNRTRKIRQKMYDISRAAAVPNNNCGLFGDGPRCGKDPQPKYIRPNPVLLPITFPAQDLFG